MKQRGLGELKKYIKSISHKSLSTDLKELEADGLINRHSYGTVPPKVEYSLTEKGNSLIAILDELCVWGRRIARRNRWHFQLDKAVLQPFLIVNKL